MDNIESCILKYIENEYSGGLIPISSLVDYCQKPKIKIFLAIKSLERNSQVKVIKRFFCPEGHSLLNSNICNDCKQKYFDDYISIHIYILPTVKILVK